MSKNSLSAAGILGKRQGFASLGDGSMWAPIASLQCMLDSVPILPLHEALAAFDDGSSSAPSQDMLFEMCRLALEMANHSALLNDLPAQIHGLPAVNFVGALVVYSFEEPIHVYSLICDPLNRPGDRNRDSFQTILPFLKLITLAQRSVPEDSEYFFQSKSLYRGVSIDRNDGLRAKYDDYAKAYAEGTMITFPAPTSTSVNDTVASEFTKGIQFVIHDAIGIRLKGNELSPFLEDEVLLEAPLVCRVISRTKVQNTVVVGLKVQRSTMTYLSRKHDISSTTPYLTFFDKCFPEPEMIVLRKSKKSQKMNERYCSLMLDPSSCVSALTFRESTAPILAASCIPRVSHSRHITDSQLLLMGPGTSLCLTSLSGVKDLLCVELNIQPLPFETHTLFHSDHIFGTFSKVKTGKKNIFLCFLNKQSFDTFVLCAQMCFCRSFRGFVDKRSKVGSYDVLPNFLDQFSNSFSADVSEFCSKYFYVAVSIRPNQRHDVLALSRAIVVELKSVLLSQNIIINHEFNKDKVYIRAPNICWLIEKIAFEKKVSAAVVLQKHFKAQHKLRFLKQLQLSADFMGEKIRRVSSAFRPFFGNHYDAIHAARVQSILKLHATKSKAATPIDAVFCTPVFAAFSSAQSSLSFHWTSSIAVLSSKLCIILGFVIEEVDAMDKSGTWKQAFLIRTKNIGNQFVLHFNGFSHDEDEKVPNHEFAHRVRSRQIGTLIGPNGSENPLSIQKYFGIDDVEKCRFSGEDTIPDMFVQQVIPICQIHKAVLSPFADDALVYPFAASVHFFF
jgi:hypothetical protein